MRNCRLSNPEETFLASWDRRRWHNSLPLKSSLPSFVAERRRSFPKRSWSPGSRRATRPASRCESSTESTRPASTCIWATRCRCERCAQFQELGHQAVIIIGDYTARVGDPSGRDSTRARLTAETIEKNAETYLNQLGRVLDLSQGRGRSQRRLVLEDVVRRDSGALRQSDDRPAPDAGGFRQAPEARIADFPTRMSLPGDAGLGLGDGAGRRRIGRHRAALQLHAGPRPAAGAEHACRRSAS